MKELRNERLAADYRGMLAIQDQPYLSWIATKGEPPYAEEYLLRIKIRTYVFRMQQKECSVGAVEERTVKVTLWPSYPEEAPSVRMLDIPPVFHPCWYSKGTYCAPVPWQKERSLKDFVKEMIATLQYDTNLIEIDAPANYKALEWYQKNRENSSLFPCDSTELCENTEEKIASLEQAAVSFGEIVDSWHGGKAKDEP